jgi:hypothetical protein
MQPRYATILLAMGSAMPSNAADKAQLPDELILSGNNVIAVEIEGKPFQLEVRPEFADAPMLNPATAIALQLKPGMFGFVSAIGPEKVSGASAVHRIDYGAGEKKQRIFWADRASSSIADGAISPASLPYKRVRFVLGEAAAGEQLFRLPLDNFGFLGRLGIGTTVKTDKEKIQFQFSLQRDETLVSAPTGNWLAENRGGKFTGPAKSTLTYFGIERPTRPMQLEAAISVGDFLLSGVEVRVSDYGDATGIAEQGAAADGDSEEIIVTGKRDKDVDLRITAGRAFLKGCSSLLYDFDKREIAISCAGQP